jgi:hypothetical protein
VEKIDGIPLLPLVLEGLGAVNPPTPFAPPPPTVTV